MYRLELDFVRWFEPPMLDSQDGIRLTRTIELPFAPSEEIALHSETWEGSDDPSGYSLKGIVWDLDNKCFLAETHLSAVDMPLAMIPSELCSLLDNGWRWGSYRDQYERSRKRKSKPLSLNGAREWDWDQAVQWDADPNAARPKEYKLVLDAIVETMATLKNNIGVAYAMHKTGTLLKIPEHAITTKLSPAERKFHEAQSSFERLSFSEQWDWCDKVRKRLPKLIDVVEAMT